MRQDSTKTQYVSKVRKPKSRRETGEEFILHLRGLKLFLLNSTSRKHVQTRTNTYKRYKLLVSLPYLLFSTHETSVTF
jgi:hypothetical protein